MSTISYESWAVDLANVGAIYPFQGAEVLMVILGIAFWLWWHIAQSRQEDKQYKNSPKPNDEAVRKAIDRY